MIVQVTNASAGTIALQNTGQDVQLIHVDNIAPSLTISFPPNPQDGQRVSIASSVGIVNMSLTSTVIVIVGNLSSLAGGSGVSYQYVLAQNKWFKVR